MQLFTEHLHYEIDMFFYTLERLRTSSNEMTAGDRNAFLESFCIHARSLIDFFSSKKTESSGEAAAIQFADASYQPFPLDPIPGPLYGTLNEQIAHLTYGRTDVPSKKLGRIELEELARRIEAEIANFQQRLQPQYASEWRISFPPLRTPSGAILSEVLSTAVINHMTPTLPLRRDEGSQERYSKDRGSGTGG
jgi:hypothetical protein